MIGEDQEIADDYLAIIEINHKNSQMSASITCPVLALDHFPKSTLDIINSYKCVEDSLRHDEKPVQNGGDCMWGRT